MAKHSSFREQNRRSPKRGYCKIHKFWVTNIHRHMEANHMGSKEFTTLPLGEVQKLSKK